MTKTTFNCGDVVALPLYLSDEGYNYGRYAYTLRSGKAMVWCWHDREHRWEQKLVDATLLRETFGQVQLGVVAEGGAS